MFEREYRWEMDQVKLSQVELDRLVNAMAEEKRRHKLSLIHISEPTRP